MYKQALKDLLFRMADDKLIIGHRNSEWCGMGPVLEEDIAFASMAQDAIGAAQSYYRQLHELGEADPDALAFNRSVAQFRCCQFVEWPNGEYEFSLMRHFLFDMAEQVRLASLARSNHKPLAELAKRIGREAKYHQLHAKTWIRQLGPATEESHERLQNALEEAYPMAFSIFEPTDYDETLAEEGIIASERELKDRWLDTIMPVLEEAQLQPPADPDPSPYMGGRKGQHSPYLQQLIDEMSEVFQIDPEASW